MADTDRVLRDIRDVSNYAPFRCSRRAAEAGWAKHGSLANEINEGTKELLRVAQKTRARSEKGAAYLHKGLFAHPDLGLLDPL
jgi:hypothetical protein